MRKFINHEINEMILKCIQISELNLHDINVLSTS